MSPLFNKTVLMSGAQFMTNASAINAYMHSDEEFNVEKAVEQHDHIKQALQSIGVEVKSVLPPTNCQDGIFTANWGLARGKRVLLSNLPTVRKPEMPYAKKVLLEIGIEVFDMPEDVRFSGQGDALPCGNYVFVGTNYRTDKTAHKIISDTLGYHVIPLQTVPKLDENRKPVANSETGWPDSLFYDLDMAIAILKPPTPMQKGLIAWCPEAFMPESYELIKNIDFVEKIEVPLEEAIKASACNLLSTGRAVIMNANAPSLQSAIESHSFKTLALHNEELAKNGGSVRCATLTLFNN
ncbi:MAG TPA: arginine deiminase-related protein [Patescibacteria group bacterium]|nr:arginine deiminase-related protein [Patescibacteria group bacterium]